ncbi:MAG: protein kinase [Lentisphaeraceae bacterium]|nr:protein kinase [Lentisphaeraceae bacterium]
MPNELPESVLLQAFEEADTSGIDDLAEKLSGNRFDSKKLSGEGGAKEVYSVKDLVTGRKLALAYPRGDSKDDYELILKEARLHSLLEHPNIVRLYDIGLDGNKPFFTMKFAGGVTLEKFIREKPAGRDLSIVQINELLDIYLKVCEAISYAHSKDVSHLDLKPSNVFLDDHGEVLVGDWGLARVSNEPEKTYELPLEQDYGQTTLHGYINGTPGYMAPEQCAMGLEKGHASDIYSLGALLVFLYSHKPPVQGDEDEKILATVKGDLSVDWEFMPTSIQHIAQKALNYSPEDRYRSVKGLIQDIQKYRSGFMTSAEPSSFYKQLNLFIQRNRLISSLIILFVSLLAIVTMVYVESVKSKEKDTRQALVKLEMAQKEKDQLNKKRAEESYRQALELYEDSQQGLFSYDKVKNKLAFFSIQRALDLDPEIKKAWELRGKLAILLNDWQEAIISFKESGQKAYLDRVQKIHKMKKTPAQILVQIDAIGDEELTQYLIFRETYERNSLEDRAAFCKAALLVLNKKVTDINFNFEETNYSLDLSGNEQLENLYPIRTMRIQRLNINGCKSIKSFKYLKELPLLELSAANSSLDDKGFRYIESKVINNLDISNCNISRLKPIINMPLKTLNISGIAVAGFPILKNAISGIKITCSSDQEPELQELNKKFYKNWGFVVKD